MRLRGCGLIGAVVAPSFSAAPGVWSLADVLAAQKAGTWPSADPILSVFADGTDGFYFDFSKADRLFKEAAGQTLVSAAGDNVGLAFESHGWRDRTLVQELARQPELVTNGDFSDGTTGWTSNSGSIAVVSGQLQLTNPTSARGSFYQSFPTVAGQTYVLTLDWTAGTSASAFLQCGNAIGGTQNGFLNFSISGPVRFVFKASAATTFLTFVNNVTATGSTSIWDNISTKLISGNHGSQATTGAQPKWQAGGIARFDGSDDNLLTTLNPAASFSMMFKGKITSASKVMMGSRATTDTRALIGTDAAGLLAAGVGADSTTTIKGGSDIRGATGVGALVYGAASVKLYWNASEIYSGALNGSPNTTIPLRVGGFNDNGVGGSFADADIYYALAVKKALTPAQVGDITNKWGTS